MTATATPAVMPGAKCAHTEGEGLLHRRCAKKTDHRGNHTMLPAPPPAQDPGAVQLLHDISAATTDDSSGAVTGLVALKPAPPTHDRSVTQDAAAALEVAAKVGRISTQRFVLTVDERRLAAQLHDLIVARVGSTQLAVGELAPPAAPPP